MLSHPRDSMAPSFSHERASHGAGTRDRRRRQTKLGGGNDGNLFAAAVIVPKVNDLAVRLDETVGQVCMGSTSLAVQNAGARLIEKAELAFEMLHENADGARIVPAWRRIDVDVV